MKRIKLSTLIGGLVLSMFSCVKEDTLIFPEKVEALPNEPIDVLSKPSDVRIEGGYDYKFTIQWPEMSDKVAKVVVSYDDDGVMKTQEFTSFEEDGLIETTQAGEHTFTITAYSTTGLVSKAMVIKSTNKVHIIEEVLDNMTSDLSQGEVTVRSMNNHLVPIKMTVTYPGSSGQLSQVVESSGLDVQTTFAAQNGTHNYTVELEDEQGRKTSKEYSYTFEYIVNSSILAFFDYGQVTYSNNANSAITLKVTYPLAGGGTNTVERSFVDANASIDFPTFIGTHQVQVEYVDSGGRTRNETLTYTQKPYSLKTYGLNQSKTSVVESIDVSSIHAGNGGGPTLIDGNGTTFWHTPWSGTIPPFPHWCAVTFRDMHRLTQVMFKIRDHATPNGPGVFEVQVSNDGVNYTTHEEFTNTVNTRNADLTFTLATPVTTKYVRLYFKTSLSNTAFMNLAEIGFVGYTED